MNGDLAVGKRDWEDYRWKEIFAKVSLNENTMSGFNMPRHCRNFRFQLIDDKIDEERGSISEKPGRSSLIKPSTAKKTHLKCHRCAAWQKEGSNFFFHNSSPTVPLSLSEQQCHCWKQPLWHLPVFESQRGITLTTIFQIPIMHCAEYHHKRFNM